MSIHEYFSVAYRLVLLGAVKGSFCARLDCFLLGVGSDTRVTGIAA